MKKLTLLLVSIVFSVVLVGCSNTRPILNISSVVPNNLTLEKVERGILAAQNADRGWTLKKESKNVIVGELYNRGFTATIKITYNTDRYEIQYVSSQNLKAANGKIHRNYNRWVANLDKDIQSSLRQQ